MESISSLTWLQPFCLLECDCSGITDNLTTKRQPTQRATDPTKGQRHSKESAAINFVRDVFGYLKAIAIDNDGQVLLRTANIRQDAGMIDANDMDPFITMAKTRQWDWEKSVRTIANMQVGKGYQIRPVLASIGSPLAGKVVLSLTKY